MSDLSFDLFSKHGRQIKEYFSWPEELRAALPAIEKLKLQLSGTSVDPQRAPHDFLRSRPVRRRTSKRRYKCSGVRVEWTSPCDSDPLVTKREFVRLQFSAITKQYGKLPVAQAKIVAKQVGCTIAALRNEYYAWSRRG